jgi:N-terminal acetyltransferase B complex non-catalytic subunit
MLQAYGKAVEDDGNIIATLLSTDRHPADDLSILSAMCLVKLSTSTDDGSNILSSMGIGYWLRAIMLLEHAWTHSKSNFQISLLLVKLYSYIGCGSLALRAYQRLNIKQIQHNTLAHIIFDQISSLHPHPFTQNLDDSTPLRSPLDHFKEQLDFYNRAPNQINKNIWRAFQLGSYNSIFELTEFSEKLSNSLAKVTSVVEGGKIFRLANPNTPLPSEFSVPCKCICSGEETRSKRLCSGRSRQRRCVDS